MNLTTRMQMKVNSLLDYYIFQHAGLPKVKKEKISKSVLKKYLPANPVIIDCGAHDGTDSVELAKILSGTVHAFEPIPDIYQRLKLRTKKYPNIHTYTLALGNENGKQHFFVSEGGSDASSSLLEPSEHLKDHPDTRFNNRMEVEAMTLDEWSRQFNISRVDLLWLDMQGFELNMLKASVSLLPTVRMIHTEVSTKETYKGVALYSEYRQFLEEQGFSVVLEAIPQGWDMGNVLFLRK